MDINTKPIIINATLPMKGFGGRHHTASTKQKISDSKKGVANMKNRKFNEEQVKRLKEEKDSGMSITELSNRYNTSRKTIYKYLYESD